MIDTRLLYTLFAISGLFQGNPIYKARYKGFQLVILKTFRSEESTIHKIDPSA